MNKFLADLLHYAIIIAVLIFLTGTIESFIGGYITFLGGVLLEFVSMLLLLIVTDKILHAILKI